MSQIPFDAVTQTIYNIRGTFVAGTVTQYTGADGKTTYRVAGEWEPPHTTREAYPLNMVCSTFAEAQTYILTKDRYAFLTFYRAVTL